MQERLNVAPSDQLARARSELMLEATADVRRWARQYVNKPGEGAWHELVLALARAHGDATYDLLRAVEIHSETSIPR